MDNKTILRIEERYILSQRCFFLIVDQWSDDYKEFNELFSTFNLIYPAIIIVDKEIFDTYIDK